MSKTESIQSVFTQVNSSNVWGYYQETNSDSIYIIYNSSFGKGQIYKYHNLNFLNFKRLIGTHEGSAGKAVQSLKKDCKDNFDRIDFGEFLLNEFSGTTPNKASFNFAIPKPVIETNIAAWL